MLNELFFNKIVMALRKVLSFVEAFYGSVDYSFFKS